MLKFLRITGVIIFAILTGVSAYSLKSMHETGELFEKYNSSRKANVTMMSVSVLALAALCFVELKRIRNVGNRRSFGESRYIDTEEPEVDGLDTTSIYAAPESVDAWQGRRTKTARSYKEKPENAGSGFWMGWLRVVCIVLPMLYGSLLVLQLMQPSADPLVAVVLPCVFAVLLIVSVFTMKGVGGKRPWGMTMGYILAVCNLLIFPFGTVVGMFLIMGLVGASHAFADTAYEQKQARRKAARRSRVAV